MAQTYTSSKKPWQRFIALLMAFLVFASILVMVTSHIRGKREQEAEIKKQQASTSAVTTQRSTQSAILAQPQINIPAYTGKKPYVLLNHGQPYFDTKKPGEKKDFTVMPGYQEYSDLDKLGRCGTATACLGRDTMPTEPRGKIGMVKPSGWHTVKYDFIDGKYLYNRCHLIGYQLSGQNANEKNLITGTRYLNVKGMLPFENEVADYIEDTGNHVMYRVTPIFQGKELVARGVLMEAESIEDGGQGIRFCIFCYNVQPGVSINYKDGTSRAV